MANGARDHEGRFAENSFEAVYDALNREVRRIDQLRSADQLAVSAALTAAEKATSTALTAAKEAVSKAEENQRRVNEGQNEFRQQLKDQANLLMPRAESELITSGLRDSISEVQRGFGKESGRKEGSSATWSQILAVAGVAAVVGGVVVNFLVNSGLGK